MRKDERLRSLAAKGARDEMQEFLEAVVDLRQLLPNLSTLASVQAAVSALIEEIDGGPRKPRVPGIAPTRITNGHAKPPAKPTKRRKGTPAAMIKVARAKSWGTGREVLVALAAHDGGLTTAKLAKELKLSEAALYHRLKVRAKHGHIKLVDPAKRLWAITPEGRTALRNDRDSEL